ncbi:MAG: hypothetical protein U0790_03520 [Isosphaeraceae bacterium]
MSCTWPSTRRRSWIRGARVLLQQWQTLVHRFVGAPWQVTPAARPSTLAAGDLAALEPADLARFDPAFDKVWLVRVSAGDGDAGLRFQGREYDSATRKLRAAPGPPRPWSWPAPAASEFLPGPVRPDGG